MQGAAHFRCTCKDVSGNQNCEYSEHVRAKLIKEKYLFGRRFEI